MIFCHVVSEAMLYQRTHLDLDNTLINSQYLEKLVCQVLVFQSILVRGYCQMCSSTEKIYRIYLIGMYISLKKENTLYYTKHEA